MRNLNGDTKDRADLGVLLQVSRDGEDHPTEVFILLAQDPHGARERGVGLGREGWCCGREGKGT